MSAFTSALDLASLTATRGIRIIGAGAGDRTGYSLASAGDVNGDGLADLVIGMDPQSAPVGGFLTAYVVFGRPNPWGDIDLGHLGSAGFRITGAAFDGLPTYGLDVSAAGDVNGDGFGDVLVGAGLENTQGRFNNGASWVVYGKDGSFDSIDLTQPLGTAGARIDGVAAGDYTGRTVASIGDFNGDGYGDVLVGGQYFTSYGPGAFAGSAFVVFGRAGGLTGVDLAAPGAGAFRIDGAPGDNIGRRVASAGDFNGDGLADIITAGLFSQQGVDPSTASAFVIFGKTAGFGTLNLANLGQGGFRIDGISVGSSALVDVASAGDINGDGFGDLIIGSPGADNNGRTDSGSAYVILGRASGFGTIDLNNPASYAFRIDGAAQYNQTGFSVSSAGDVNGDGFSDILVGGFLAGSNFRPFSGSSYIVLGGGGGFSNIDLAQTSASVFRFDGAASDDRQGFAVAAAGDADGDGFSDILLGALTADPSGQVDAGTSYLLFSQSQGNATFRGTTLSETLRGTPDADSIQGLAGHDRLFGNAGNDTIDGSAGHDTLDGGPGIDIMIGGPGDDVFFLDNPGDGVVEVPDGGDDTAWLGAAGALTIGANIEIIRLFAAASQVTGSGSDEQIVANANLASTIAAGGGNDTIWGNSLTNGLNNVQGGDGDDIIRGLDGNGSFAGGQGNDQYVIGNTTARIVELPNQGTDTAWVTVNGYTLDPNVEILRLGGTAIQVTGSEGDEQLVANPLLASSIDARGGNDVVWGSAFGSLLNGGNGDDIIRGQGGADTMLGGNGNDQFAVVNNSTMLIEAEGAGDDTAWIAVNGYAVGANIERINLSGAANTAIGNAADNIIAGNPLMGNAYLVGGAGSDLIFGSAFADVFRGDSGNDTMYAQGGADRFVYNAPNWGYDQINGFVQGQARLDFTGSGIAFSQMFLQSANGNTQVEFGGSAILVFGVASLSAGDFLF